MNILDEISGYARERVESAKKKISAEEMKDNYLVDGGFLPTHPVKKLEIGIECSSGSLGMGLGFGIGEALAARINQKSYRTFVVMGDGECDEGSCWEAFMAARQYGLGNLLLFIDKNGYSFFFLFGKLASSHSSNSARVILPSEHSSRFVIA